MNGPAGVKRPVELVIFDCDGVLVDSEPLANRIFADELAQIGLDLGEARTRHEFTGLTMDRCVEIIEQRLGHAVPDRFVERLQERTFEAFRRELRSVPGIEQALLDLDGVAVCVASSGEHEKMRLTLGLTGLLPRFDGKMFSATDVGRGKPHPDLFLHAAREMEVVPERCAVVEDSIPGVRAGVAAGMSVFAYAKDGAEEGLSGDGVTVFCDMSELSGLIFPD